MSFFKNLFSKRKENQSQEPDNLASNFRGVYSKEYLDKRYAETPIEARMLDGCLKMIESYLIDNNISKKIDNPVNHPANLDQVDQEGFGFVLYCKALQLGEEKAILFLAYSFSEYLIKKYGFQLFKDSSPEHPLRSMTLKYANNGAALSLYPYEYAYKVLNGNQTFSEMEEKLNTQLSDMPKMKDLIDKFIDPEHDN